MMSDNIKYLDPKNDLTFKKVFGEHKHLCISLLNNLLPFEIPIVSIEYDPTELVPEIKGLKNTIVDVRCTDQNGRQFIVEMQLYWTPSFKNRVQFNSSKIIVVQVEKAQKYSVMRPIHSLCLVNDIFETSPEMKDEFYHHYSMTHDKFSHKKLDGLTYTFIELPKFIPNSSTITLNRAEKKLFDLWLKYFTSINEATQSIPQELIEAAEIKEAISIVEKQAYTSAQLEAYWKFKDVAMTEQSKIEDSFKEGIEKGLAEGIEKGLAEGKIEIAKNLLKSNIPINIIITSTGLTKEEIEKL
jgi:predicted transposase/invertase (TIGR01784 family)